mmetsp:Transcript_2777/g.8108  ORF Transcript_2777/g.8108 Transcript_2777/m.8108 type:complete len:210 (-) Transcript_2777:51-680(-)
MPEVASIKVVLDTSLQGANTMFGEACEYGLNTGDVIQSTDFGKMVPLCVTKPGDLKFDNDILSCCKKQWSQIEHKLEDGVLGVMASLPISTLFDDGVELILAADGAPKEGTVTFKKLMRSIGPVTAVACVLRAKGQHEEIIDSSLRECKERRALKKAAVAQREHENVTAAGSSEDAAAGAGHWAQVSEPAAKKARSCTCNRRPCVCRVD